MISLVVPAYNERRTSRPWCSARERHWHLQDNPLSLLSWITIRQSKCGDLQPDSLMVGLGFGKPIATHSERPLRELRSECHRATTRLAKA